MKEWERKAMCLPGCSHLPKECGQVSSTIGEKGAAPGEQATDAQGIGRDRCLGASSDSVPSPTSQWLVRRRYWCHPTARREVPATCDSASGDSTGSSDPDTTDAADRPGSPPPLSWEEEPTDSDDAIPPLPCLAPVVGC